MKLYNSNQGRVASKMPRRRIGQMSADLVNELKNVSKLEQIYMYMKANAINIRPIN